MIQQKPSPSTTEHSAPRESECDGPLPVGRPHAGLVDRLRGRPWLSGAAYVAVFSVAYLGAFLLRFDFNVPGDYMVAFWMTLPVVIAMKLAVFGFSGQLHGWLRLVSFRDLTGLASACLLALLLLATADFFSGIVSLPRSVLVLDCLLTLLIAACIRSSWRMFSEVVRPMIDSRRYAPALLIGTDSETVLLARQIQSYGRLPLQVCGLIDTTGRFGTRSAVGGFHVLGRLTDIEAVARARKLEVVLVHTELLPGKLMRQLMETCERLDIRLQIVRRFEDRVTGSGQIPIRSIKIDDLLRRDAADLDLESISETVRGKSVLVTGAGGSIGSEICRQLMRFEPETLVLLGRGENRIYEIEQELRRRHSATTLETVIADIRDRSRIDEIFFEYGPHIVFHTAAHKHVPLMERNVREAVLNNVIGTQTVAEAADKFGVNQLVMISSDKAVRPSSVMGATKRLAELVVQATSQRSRTKFMTVRFGNVLGSAGSVVPLFKKQIEYGGPITVTDQRMTRYFMTIPEASQLVLQAAAMGSGGDLFVLDMGAPVRIVDLARDMIRLSGLPADAIEIVFEGIRPGEKLHEELADEAGHIVATDHPKIMSISPTTVSEPEILAQVNSLCSESASDDEIRDQLLAVNRATSQV